jgi:hypothetical protein
MPDQASPPPQPGGSDPAMNPPTWVLPTPLPSNPPGDNVAGGGSDPLEAFLDGLQGLSSSAGPPSNGPAASIVTMLSNGLNADAGVAQLVSALASLRDGASAFDAGPFAPSSDPVPQLTIAASSQGGSS